MSVVEIMVQLVDDTCHVLPGSRLRDAAPLLPLLPLLLTVLRRSAAAAVALAEKRNTLPNWHSQPLISFVASLKLVHSSRFVRVSRLRRGHASLLCIVPSLMDDPRRESCRSHEALNAIRGSNRHDRLLCTSASVLQRVCAVGYLKQTPARPSGMSHLSPESLAAAEQRKQGGRQHGDFGQPAPCNGFLFRPQDPCLTRLHERCMTST